MNMSKGNATYTRNIQGRSVRLTLVEVDPSTVELDPHNPRIGFSMRQLDSEERKEAAAELLLTSQEDTEALKRSIILSGGVQEPIYIRHDGVVAEGNRRVVALRAAREEHPGDERFERLPAWQIPEGTPAGTPATSTTPARRGCAPAAFRPVRGGIPTSPSPAAAR